MNRRRPAVTIVLHRDGQVESRSYRVPVWLLRTLSLTALVVLFLGLLAAVSYGPVARAAARVPVLSRDIRRLTAENEEVRRLAERLVEMETRYAQIRGMLGGDVLPAPVRTAEDLPAAYPITARPPDVTKYEPGESVPRYWPLRGVVTRGQTGEGGVDELHPGIDIAVPMGTPIRAAGGGEVGRTGRDPDYGLFVLIRHPDGYETMYGHASRILVEGGEQVGSGQVIALSGSTGRSTAPHLHFEVRRGGRSIDPRTIVKEDT